MWKAKNKARNQTQEQRAPRTVIEHGAFIKFQKFNLHYTRGITPKRVTSGGRRGPSLLLGAWATATMKRHSGGEPLATLCPV